MAKKPPTRTEPAEGVSVPIRWVGDTSFRLEYANQVHVRRAGECFYVTFGQVNLPVFDGPPSEGFVAEIRPVVRMVVTATDYANIVAAMQRVLSGGSVGPEEKK